MKTLALAAFATFALSIPFSTANAAPGPVIITGGWGCQSCGYSNGTQLTGVALGKASTGTVSAVILPSGKFAE